MVDTFEHYNPDLTTPGERHYTVTASDTVALSPRPRSLRILTTGNLAVKDAGGTTVVYPVTAGEMFVFRATYVMATGTTATAAAWY